MAEGENPGRPVFCVGTFKQRALLGLRAKGFEYVGGGSPRSALNGWWKGTATEPGMRVGAVPAWQEATQRDSWSLVSPFLCAAAPTMLATHARNIEMDCAGSLSSSTHLPTLTSWGAASPT
jgi:hypothetical protein